VPARAATVLTGTRIRERRLAMARRQADIARAVGISPAYLNLIEHNRRPVGADLIARLAPYRGPKGNLIFPHTQTLPLDLIGEVAEQLARQYAD